MATIQDYQPDENCPLADSHDKFSEAHFFLEQMLERYHEPQPFRWNLNAFLQARSSVEEVLHGEVKAVDGLTAVFNEAKAEIWRGELAQRFQKVRNIVVHRSTLEMQSAVTMGVYRNRRLKLAMEVPVSPHIPTDYIIQHIVPDLGFLGAHEAIGEEYGVTRVWKTAELGKDDVIALCDRAWAEIGQLLAKLHAHMGIEWAGPKHDGHSRHGRELLTESDLDPTLPQKWGWVP
ncbi:MAG: hypothetical protein ACYC2H_06755 [Thermoplasmatota archaeon]